MIDSLEIRNFQSLKDVQLDLGPLTVIVGSSNCGKSALVRSVQALSSNVRGTSAVTHGCKMASVTAVSEASRVTLEKGEGHGAYRLLDSSGEKEYTKLAGDVPVEITKALGLDPVKDGSSLNFAAQHDPPFLLTSAGSAVARTLGDLTKVSTVLEAVREANRRRTSSSGDLKLRARDLEEAEKGLKVLESLKARKESLLEAEKHIRSMQSVEAQLSDLEEAVRVAEEADRPLPDVRSIDTLLEAHAGFHVLYQQVLDFQQASRTLESAADVYNDAVFNHAALDEELKEALREAGRCPTCGKTT